MAQGDERGLAEIACVGHAHGVGADGDVYMDDVLPECFAVGGEQVLGGDV